MERSVSRRSVRSNSQQKIQKSAKKHYIVSPDEYNFEAVETPATSLPDFLPILQIIRPPKGQILPNNIFESAEFWL
jgi:hypothetical protein